MTLLVECTRGNYVEDKHYGAFAVVNDQGKILDQQGNIEHPIFVRSSVKLLQTLFLIESGAADRWNLTDKEIALACASHHGEDIHVEVAENWARKLKVGEGALYCGVQRPLNVEAAKTLVCGGNPATVFHNPCSGKHLGFITAAFHLEEPVEDYISRKHPVQKRIERILSEMTSFETLVAPVGIDGCSAPAFTFPLYNLALGYARFGSENQSVPYPRRKAAQRIINAVRENSVLLAGTMGYDTKVIDVTGGRVITKFGASSVMAATIPEKGVGIALKIEDGCHHVVAEVVMTYLLHKHNLISHAEYSQLDPVRPILSQAGHKVGEIKMVTRGL